MLESVIISRIYTPIEFRFLMKNNFRVPKKICCYQKLKFSKFPVIRYPAQRPNRGFEAAYLPLNTVVVSSTSDDGSR